MLAVARGQGVDVVYGVRSDRSTDTAFKRLVGPGLLHVDPGDVRRRRPRRRRRLPADVAGHGGCRERAARARPGAAARRAGAGLPERVGRLRARGTGRGRLEVPAGQDDPALHRRRHRVLDRPAALRDLAGPARRAGRAGRARLRLRGDGARQHASRLDVHGRHRGGGGGRAAARARHPRASTWGAPTPRCRPARRTSSPTTPSTRGRTTAARVRPGSDRRPRRPTWSS